MAINNKERTTSSYHPYSVGIAAENKERNTVYLEVAPIEQLTMLNGQLSASVNEVEASSSDSDGVAYQEKMYVTATVKAKWRPMGGTGNRMTAPDIRRGEQVMLYQFGDTDEFFWDELDTNIAGRKLESTTWAYSGTQDEEDTDLTPENTYAFNVSTHDGLVGFSTSDKNGEVTKYNVNFNSKEGIIDIKDSAGNGFYLNTKDAHVKLYNGNGSLIEAIGDVINMNCKTMNITTSNINIKGERVHEGNSTHKGNVALQGGLSGEAGAGGDGSATFQGGIQTQKDIQTQADVKASGKSLVNHTHTGVHGVTSPPN